MTADLTKYFSRELIVERWPRLFPAGPSAGHAPDISSLWEDFTDVKRATCDFLTADMLSRSHKRRKTQMGDMQVAESGMAVMQNRPQIIVNYLFRSQT